MHSSQTPTFKKALVMAAVCHVIVFAVLMVRFSFSSKDDSKQLIITQVPVQAELVDESKLKAEVQRLENLEKQKRDKQLAEERRIEEAKEKLAQEKEAEKKRLADVQKQKVAEQKRLEESRKQAALEQQKKVAQEKAEAQRQAELKKKQVADAAKAKADAEKAKADAAKVAQQKAQADKLAAEAAARVAAQNAVASAESLREIERYKAMVRQQIMRYWTVQGGLAQKDATKLFVRVAPTGTVLDVKVVQSSGNDALDRSAIAAVYKASPLPVPQDPDLFRSFRELRLTLRPDSILSEG